MYESQKKYYRKCKKRKICTHCGKEPAGEKSPRCAICRSKASQAMKEFNARRKAAGLCYNCKAPVTSGKTRCAECLAKSNLYFREYRKKYKDWFAGVKKKHSLKLRMECITAYGGKCVCCGESMPAFLTIDHVNNDGKDERMRLGIFGGVDFIRWLKKQGYPKERYQLLCYNCNMAKSHYGTCPHQQVREGLGS